MSTLELNREATQPIEPNDAIPVNGVLPCGVCLGVGWIVGVHDSGEPCQACQDINYDIALALA